MTHLALLLHELATRGETTYTRLMRVYGGQGYNYEGFTAAVCRARKLGIVAPRDKSGRIVPMGCCPTCGQKLGKGER